MNTIHNIAYSIAPAATQRVDREIMSKRHYNNLISSGVIQGLAQELADQVKYYTGPIKAGIPKMFKVSTESVDPMIEGTLAERLLLRRLHRHIEYHLNEATDLKRRDIRIWDVLRPSIDWHRYESPHKSDIKIGVWYQPRKH